MKKLTRDSIKEIKNTYRRFLSILLIVLLGVGFFAGIKATSPDMRKTVDEYFDKKQVFDIQVLSTLGLTQEDKEQISQIQDVKIVEESYHFDVLNKVGKEEYVVKVHSLQEQLNQVEKIEGRLPQEETECVVEQDYLTATGQKIGDKLILEEETESTYLKKKEMTIVGTIRSPLYLSRDRGSSKLRFW